MKHVYTLALLLVSLLYVPGSMAAGNADDKAKQKSNAIIRSEETVFTVTAINSATTTFKTTITILNANGEHRAKLYIPYDKLSKVSYIKGTLYDANGKKVKQLKNSDIKDVSAVSDASLFDDNRIKIANLSMPVYPFTVEYEYQKISKNLMFYPTWYPLDEENLSVENAFLRVEMPKGMKLRYHEANLPEKVKQEATATHDVYLWQVKNLEPVREEPYGPDLKDMVPLVRTAPTVFEVDGYQGNMESWKSYGQFIDKLNQGRDVLPAETAQKLQAMVAGTKTPEEKIEKVYDYLQSKTRYVSIQLGIGGWQPFEASFVDTKGYGDCKALTNYTQAMLKTVGVNSYQALIRAGGGESDILTDFPSSQFNHVVLYVPTANDTIWLECTSQNVAAGYAGSHTGGRHALLITPEGGKLIKTPDYTATDNVQRRAVKVKLDEKGNGKASVTTLYTGLQQESRSDVLHNLKPDEQRKWIYQQTKLPSFEITNFTLEQKKAKLPSVTEKLELDLRQSATISGKRMFLTTNLMNKWSYAPEPLENRKTDVIRTLSFLDVDSITYELPVGYTLEHKPQDIVFKSKFGEYRTSIKVDGQNVAYVRVLQMDKGRYSKELYPKYLEFMNQIIKGDTQQVVFVKNIP
ncbi:DUF3857 domain-containing protein [uncultured Pontibacter sp.]|uniref:DUF3857 domain-containing protein n=1 Tax=uncultured Pontibacter sp. TaxID=453356 RepID=UPI00262DADD0|nr:DUF3857 domain-containing protein [uncultured Pontibacter sp.]